MIVALLLLATALVYANGLGNPFVDDDQLIISQNFQPWRSWTLPDMFTRSLFSTDPSESMYVATYFRPLTLLTFAVNYSLAGQTPHAYRVVNLGLHLLVIVLTILLGKYYLTKGNRQHAREEWELALRFDPDHPDALRLLSKYPKE